MFESGLWEVIENQGEIIPDSETKHRANTILPGGGASKRNL